MILAILSNDQKKYTKELPFQNGTDCSAKQKKRVLKAFWSFFNFRTQAAPTATCSPRSPNGSPVKRAPNPEKSYSRLFAISQISSSCVPNTSDPFGCFPSYRPLHGPKDNVIGPKWLQRACYSENES